jgi:hypothetical protein
MEAEQRSTQLKSIQEAATSRRATRITTIITGWLTTIVVCRSTGWLTTTTGVTTKGEQAGLSTAAANDEQSNNYKYRCKMTDFHGRAPLSFPQLKTHLATSTPPCSLGSAELVSGNSQKIKVI